MTKQPTELKAEDYERLCDQCGANYRKADHQPAKGHVKALMPIVHKLKCDGLGWAKINRWLEDQGVSYVGAETIASCWRRHCTDWLPYVKRVDLSSISRTLSALPPKRELFALAIGMGRVWFASESGIYSFPEDSGYFVASPSK